MSELFLKSLVVTLGALTAIGLAAVVCALLSLLFDWITGKLSMREDLKKELKGACAGGIVGCPGGHTCTSDHK